MQRIEDFDPITDAGIQCIGGVFATSTIDSRMGIHRCEVGSVLGWELRSLATIGGRNPDSVMGDVPDPDRRRRAAPAGSGAGRWALGAARGARRGGRAGWPGWAAWLKNMGLHVLSRRQHSSLRGEAPRRERKQQTMRQQNNTLTSTTGSTAGAGGTLVAVELSELRQAAGGVGTVH